MTSVQWLQLIKTVDPSRSAKLWQRNYYEHVIRDEDELRRIREYICINPLKWQLDHENPEHIPNSDHERDWGWLEGIAALA